MARYDGSRTPAPPRVTAGQVYVALTADPWATDKLRLAYHKIFEQGSVRPGENENAHFRYVETSRARAEINDLGAWISERFGDPFAGAPKTTPFGYHGAVKYDGWIALFSDLACSEGEEDLRKHFDEVVSKMPWNVPTTSRASAAASSTAAGTGSASASAPRPPAPPEAEAPGLFRRIRDVVSPFAGASSAPASFTSPYVTGAAPSRPSAPSPTVFAAPEKPGIVERFLGVEAPKPSPPQPAPTSTATSSPISEETPWTEEEEAEARNLYKEILSKRAALLSEEDPEAFRKKMKKQDVENLRAQVELDRKRLESVEKVRSRQAVGETVSVPEPSDIQRKRAERAQQADLTAALPPPAASASSTVKQLERPTNPNNPGAF